MGKLQVRRRGAGRGLGRGGARGRPGPLRAGDGPAYAEDVSLPVAFLLAAAAGESFLDDREEVVAVEAPVIEESFTVDAAPDAALLTKAAELRTEVFSPHLTTVGSRYLQTRRYEDELKEAAGVAVAVSGGDVVGVASAAAVPADAWYVRRRDGAPVAAPRRRLSARRSTHWSTPLDGARDKTRGHNAALLHVVETNAAARALRAPRLRGHRRGFLAAACAAAVAREIEAPTRRKSPCACPAREKNRSLRRRRRSGSGRGFLLARSDNCCYVIPSSLQG